MNTNCFVPSSSCSSFCQTISHISRHMHIEFPTNRYSQTDIHMFMKTHVRWPVHRITQARSTKEDRSRPLRYAILPRRGARLIRCFLSRSSLILSSDERPSQRLRSLLRCLRNAPSSSPQHREGFLRLLSSDRRVQFE